MSGLNEIIQWTDDNIVFERDEPSQRAFEDISDIFEEDSRLPLADILQEQLPDFLRYIEEKTGTTSEDIELAGMERTIANLEEEIRGFFNMLGTPIR